jgi:hypothetical protein
MNFDDRVQIDLSRKFVDMLYNLGMTDLPMNGCHCFDAAENVRECDRIRQICQTEKAKDWFECDDELSNNCDNRNGRFHCFDFWFKDSTTCVGSETRLQWFRSHRINRAFITTFGNRIGHVAESSSNVTWKTPIEGKQGKCNSGCVRTQTLRRLRSDVRSIANLSVSTRHSQGETLNFQNLRDGKRVSWCWGSYSWPHIVLASCNEELSVPVRMRWMNGDFMTESQGFVKSVLATSAAAFLWKEKTRRWSEFIGKGVLIKDSLLVSWLSVHVGLVLLGIRISS